MELNYQLKSGQLYAKVPGHSVRRDGKIIKTGVLYLGRVIDKEHNVFYSRERGIFTYDPETGSFGKADETYVSDLPSRSSQEGTHSAGFWRFLFYRFSSSIYRL